MGKCGNMESVGADIVGSIHLRVVGGVLKGGLFIVVVGTCISIVWVLVYVYERDVGGCE